MKFYDCATAPSPRRVRIFLAEKGLSMPTVLSAAVPTTQPPPWIQIRTGRAPAPGGVMTSHGWESWVPMLVFLVFNGIGANGWVKGFFPAAYPVSYVVKTVVVAGCGSFRSEHAIGRPGLRIFGQRQFAALSDPDAIRSLGEDCANGSPGPSLVFDAIGTIRQRLQPVLDQFVGTEFFLAASFLICCGRRS